MKLRVELFQILLLIELINNLKSKDQLNLQITDKNIDAIQISDQQQQQQQVQSEEQLQIQQQQEMQRVQEIELEKAMRDKLFNYDIKNREKYSCLNMGNLKVEGDIEAQFVKTRTLFIRENIKSEKKMEVKKVIAKGGRWHQLKTDQIDGINNELKIEGDVYISTVQTESLESQSSFIHIDSKINYKQLQWMLVKHDHFDDKKATGWNIEDDKLNSCFEGDYFIGGQCRLSGNRLFKTYVLDQPHSFLKIEMNLHVFDQWNGEHVALKIDNQVLFNTTFNSHSYHYNICGDYHPDVLFNYPLQFIIRHNQTTLNLDFTTNQTRHSCQSSFAIDNVLIYIQQNHDQLLSI